MPHKILSHLTPRALWSLTALIFVVLMFLLIFRSPKATSHPKGSEERRPDQTEDRAPHELTIPLFGAAEKKSSFDGLPIDPEYDERVVSVMVDNFALARAQHSGIRKASIVYEALAEGGITRLMLVFPYQETLRVGPIRSAREYFVDFAQEYGGVYAHAGGAPSALEKLSKSALLNFDEDDPLLSPEPYSMRDPRYSAPHNLFYNLLLIRERATARSPGMSSPKKAWCFTEKIASEELPSGEHIALDFSHDKTSSYFVQMNYDASEKVYKRSFGLKGVPHTDQADGLQVAPTNVIVQIAPTELIVGDQKERLRMKDVGEGKILFFTQGKKMEGAWKKEGAESVTKYFDRDGALLCIHPGQTWIAILDDESLVESK